MIPSLFCFFVNWNKYLDMTNVKLNTKAPLDNGEGNYTIKFSSAIIAALLFIALSFALYYPAINYGYVLDDKVVYTENDYTLAGVDGIPDLLTKESFVGYFKEQKDLVQGARYRPISMITFAIENSLFGLNSKVSHGVNILLYGICGLLIFLGLGRMIGFHKKWFLGAASVATLLWLAHAIHVEAVASVKGRDEIISLIFGMTALLVSFRYYDSEKKSIWTLIAAGLTFFLGLMTKENVVTFLAVIPLSFYFFRSFSWKKTIPVLISMGAATLLYLVIRVAVIGYLFSGTEVSDIMNNPYFNLDPVYKYGMITYVMGKYLFLNFIPFPLTHDYYPWQIPKVDFGNIYVLLSLLAYVALLGIAAMGFRKKQIWSYLILFFLATLSIYSNIVFNIGTTMNDRFLFTSSIASCLAIVYAGKWLGEKLNQKWIPYALAGIFFIAYSIFTIQRVPAWENELTLNEAAIEVSTNSARANLFYATALYKEQKKYTEAAYREELLKTAYYHADRSTEIHPFYFNGNKMKAGIAAEIFQLYRDEDKLLEVFREVAVNRPDIPFLEEYHDYLEGIVDTDKMVDYYCDVVYEGLLPKRNMQYANKYLNRALKLNPVSAEANYLMAVYYQRSNQEQLSQSHLSTAKRTNPNIVEMMEK